MALALNVGFVPVRKPGKLPFETHAFRYELEYGQHALEMHVDGLSRGQNVLVVDDLLARGGTIEACCHLIEKLVLPTALGFLVVLMPLLFGEMRLVVTKLRTTR